MAFARGAGILLHPTSLPGGHGIGDMGREAYRFVDFLTEAGFTLWQVLPLGPTGAANSPYQSLSSFAGNTLLISLEKLSELGLLTPPDMVGASFRNDTVEFDKVGVFKEEMLRKAYANFVDGKGESAFQEGYATFVKEEAGWLDDFALFVALKKDNGGAAWFQWRDSDLINHKADALDKARVELADEVGFQSFCQYAFFSQWRALRKYANDRKVRLMGDVPIYVAHDSADCWAAPGIFKLDEKGNTTSAAGVPPDYFSATGQLWGNPIYRWDVLKQDGYAWWIERIRKTLEMVDLLRIDHFRGFAQFWEVPAGESTAINGKWIDGPGDDFFKALHKALGELPIIAEDLGIITDDVLALRERNNLPGMKILQFAFCDGAEMYLPHTYDRNCVVYTATHDTDTTRGRYGA
ncbi:MAG: 4-alpha-glucanotransferase, partial [Planctomycetes bacterium]|nr:4-alpha-glucanotransferase [Planctomycetota bacterium]